MGNNQKVRRLHLNLSVVDRGWSGPVCGWIERVDVRDKKDNLRFTMKYFASSSFNNILVQGLVTIWVNLWWRDFFSLRLSLFL